MASAMMAELAFVAIRDILFHLEPSSSAQPVIDFAISLAVMTGAHLTAGGIVVEYPPPTVYPSIGSAGFTNLAAIEMMVQERLAAVERSYEEFLGRAPAALQTELVIIQGYQRTACDDFARLARYADLSVVGQPAPGRDRLDELVASATLLGSGRPVFIIPFVHKGPARLERAMICWDGGMEVARTLAACMPVLAFSKNVEVVRIGGESGGPDIARHLARHGLAAAMTELPAADDIGNAILSCAADIGADYIVMGAYGHWRLTEFVMGGTTRTVLSSMTAPVLMTH